MPSHAGPNTTGESNIVFSYDTGDTSNSYRGEPTTNVLLNTNLDTGWSKDYQTNIIIGDPYPKPAGITSQAVSFTSPNSYGYWYSYGDYAPQSDNTTYSVSIWARTVGNNFTIEPYTADNSESHRFWMPGKQVIGNGEWQRLTWNNAFTTPSNNDSDSLSFQLSSMSTNQRFWLLAPQLEPKSHVTPFVVGTRSATQGLLPLISNSTINLSNVSFDSNAQITFDGTDDYINLGSNASWAIGGNGTIEILVKPLNSTGNDRLWCVDNNSTSLDAYLNGTSYNVYMHGGSVGTTTPLTQNAWNHLVVTYSGGTIQIYINGIPGTMTGTTTGYNITNNGAMYLGCFINLAYNLYGSIPVFKIYNIALSANQVKQNYQQYKTRFNLS